MSYRNKTYVIFDGDNDMWAYAYMIGWKENEHIEFNFHNAHDINVIRTDSNENTVKRKLRERFETAKQVIVVIGENTKSLYRYIRWELEVALDLDLPIISINLNGLREQDKDRCPPIIRDKYVVHIPFKKGIIKYALDNFPGEYKKRAKDTVGPRQYPNQIYKDLGLN